jgi:hypothetical protein
MNFHVNVTPMHTVIAHLRDGKTIEAIKQFRIAYGCGLKEAKDACEAIRDSFMPNGAQPTEYVVLSRFDHDYDWRVTRGHDKASAMADAKNMVDAREETIVARITAHSITTRAIKEVA